MKSMKTTAAERKARREKYDKPCSVSDGESYPYGLAISLDEESMEKLALKTLPKVGVKMLLTAEVNVESVEQRESTDGGSRRSMRLQITAMDLGAKGSAKDAIDKAIKDA